MENDKTFTQEQVNAIVGKRLAEHKASMEQDLTDRETALIKREMSIKAREMLQEKKLPLGLADVLKYDDEESLVSAIQTIEHTRGFSSNSKEEPTKKVIENKIETVGEHVEPDKVRQAMGLE